MAAGKTVAILEGQAVMVERFETALIVHLTPFEVQEAITAHVRANFIGLTGEEKITFLEPEKNCGAEIVIRPNHEQKT